MQRLPQQAPAFGAAARFLEVDPDAFVVRLLQRKPGGCLCVFFKIGKYFVPVRSEVFTENRDPDFLLVRRVFQIRDDAVDLLALLEQLRRFDDDLRGQIGAVIQKEVLLQRRVA